MRRANAPQLKPPLVYLEARALFALATPAAAQPIARPESAGASLSKPGLRTDRSQRGQQQFHKNRALEERQQCYDRNRSISGMSACPRASTRGGLMKVAAQLSPDAPISANSHGPALHILQAADRTSASHSWQGPILSTEHLRWLLHQ